MSTNGLYRVLTDAQLEVLIKWCTSKVRITTIHGIKLRKLGWSRHQRVPLQINFYNSTILYTYADGSLKEIRITADQVEVTPEEWKTDLKPILQYCWNYLNKTENG